MSKLTYEEYETLKQAAKLPSLYELYRSVPEEVKELYDPDNWDFLDELEETYSLSDTGVVSRPMCDVMVGLISVKDLPIFIERNGKLDRRVALKCAIKVCRHFLKQCSQYIDYIGNVDAYIEDWKDELGER